jgi:hypothetical protein
MNNPFSIRAPSADRLAAAAILLLLSSSAGMAQFHAIPDPDGDTVVLDTEGAPVDIAPADPVGVKPDYCPHTSYYVFEIQSDKTELVLADCLTGLHQFTVDMQGLVPDPDGGG